MGEKVVKKNLPIETVRLVLRPFMESDAVAVGCNSRQPAAAHFLPDMVLPDEEAALEWIRWINRSKMDVSVPFVALAVELKSGGSCIGMIGVAPKQELENEIEIMFSIADKYQNQGYISEAVTALISWVFENTPAEYLVAIVKLDNPASVRVIEKTGFRYSGERRIEYDGVMTDFHYYRLEKAEYTRIISLRENPEYRNRA